MNHDSPLISVILPVYNGAAHIAEAIDSVLAQQHRPLEILVVDDGSADESAVIAAGYGEPVRCFRQDNRGPAAARNLGLSMARGSLIAFIDADDVWSPDKLHWQLSLLTTTPSVMVVRGHVQRFSGAEREFVGEPWAAIHLGSSLFRKTAFDLVGPLDETQRLSEDVDWFMRAQQAGLQMLVHRQVVLYYRRHEGNTTRDHEANRREFLLATYKATQRSKQRDGGTG